MLQYHWIQKRSNRNNILAVDFQPASQIRAGFCTQMCHKKVAKMIFAVVATSQTRSNCRCFLMRFFNHHQKNQKNSHTNSYDAFRFISTSHDAFWWKLIVYVEMMVNVDEMTNSKVKIIWGCNNGSWSLKDDYKRRWVARSNFEMQDNVVKIPLKSHYNSFV